MPLQLRDPRAEGGSHALRVAHHRSTFQRDFISLSWKISRAVYIKSSFWCQQWILLCYWKESKPKCLRVQLIYPNRKCFLKNYGTIFITNLSQTQNWINIICSFKTNLFFLILGKNTFLAFIHQLILHTHPHIRAQRFACDGISASEAFGLNHLPRPVGRRRKHVMFASRPVCGFYLFLTINKARKCLKGAGSDGKGCNPKALIDQEPK